MITVREITLKNIPLLIYGSILLLVLSGGGIFPLPVFLCAFILSTGVAALALSRSTPRGASYSFIACTILLAGLLISLLPLPYWLEPTASSLRSGQDEIVRSSLAEALNLRITTFSPAFISFTRNRPGTIRFILLIIATLSTCVCISSLAWPRRVSLVRGLILMNTAIAIAALAGQYLYPQGKTLFWFIEAKHGAPFGCFMNRNHFGGFSALSAVTALVLASWRLHARKAMPAILWGTIFLILSLSVAASQSRGALVALGAGIVAVLVISLRHRVWSSLLLTSFLAALMLSIVFIYPEHPITKRVASINPEGLKQSLQLRVDAWRDGVRIAADYPLFGSGANSFRMLHPSYRTTSARKQFRNAENEYVQVTAELGILGLLCIAVICILSVRAITKLKSDVPDQNMLAAASSAVFATAMVHAIGDFALHLPLYLLFAASIVACGTPQELPRIKSASRLQAFLACIPLLALLVISPRLQDAFNLDSPDFLQETNPHTLSRALASCPTSWNSWYNLGRASMRKPGEEAVVFAEKCVTTASEYNPLDYRLMLELARLRLSMGNKSAALEAYGRTKALRNWIRDPELESIEAGESTHPTQQ